MIDPGTGGPAIAAVVERLQGTWTVVPDTAAGSRAPMTHAGSLPSVPGAYVLALHLARPVVLDIATLPLAELVPGHYAYVGSARGPGGIRARVRRHLRRDKKAHWHIDHLTAIAAIRAVAALPGHNECEVVSALRVHADMGVPIPGFGSSDCRTCEAHLVTLPMGVSD